MRFLSLWRWASECAFGDGMCQLLIQQFFSLFAQFKTITKSHENYVFLYPFYIMAISPQINEKSVFYTGKLYGLTGMILSAASAILNSSKGDNSFNVRTMRLLCNCLVAYAAQLN